VRNLKQQRKFWDIDVVVVVDVDDDDDVVIYVPTESSCSLLNGEEG